METNKTKESLKFAYLLDEDNLIVENKMFIDMMWNIAKTKLVSMDKNGKMVMSAKSYVIRNAAVMFQKIFFWHYKAIKTGAKTTYRYGNQNTIKMDFEDWWEQVRLTDTEVTTANKLLEKVGLIKIVRIPIRINKEDGTKVTKSSNCYIINMEYFESQLNNIIDISKEIYEDKVEKSRKHNSISRKKSAPLETGDASNNEDLEGIEDKLSTESTESTDEKNSAPLVTGGTEAPCVTSGTEAPAVTGGTDTSYNPSENPSDILSSPNPSIPLWDKIKEIVRSEYDITPISYKTWFIEVIAKVTVKNYNLNIYINGESMVEVFKAKNLVYISGALEKMYDIKYKINVYSIEQ